LTWDNIKQEVKVVALMQPTRCEKTVKALTRTRTSNT